MRKIILLALIATMLATPCFAQEVEPDGIFSVDGTLWSVCYIELSVTIPFNIYFDQPFIRSDCEVKFGFYLGKVFPEGELMNPPWGSYVDLGVVSIAYGTNPWGVENYYLAIMQPTIGFGVLSEGGCGIVGPFPRGGTWIFLYRIGILYKIEDNWKPAGLE